MATSHSYDRSRRWRKENPERWAQHQRRYQKKIRPNCRQCRINRPESGSPFCGEECRKISHRERARERRSKHVKKFHIYKESIGCQHCGFNAFGGALDFHHKEERGMSRITATQWISQSTRTIEELNRCTLLCANCHRKEHFEEKRR